MSKEGVCETVLVWFLVYQIGFGLDAYILSVSKGSRTLVLRRNVDGPISDHLMSAGDAHHHCAVRDGCDNVVYVVTGTVTIL